jgi:hypothetical protein
MTNFYGYAALLAVSPTADQLVEYAAHVATEHLPEIEAYEYRLSDTLPPSFPESGGNELLRLKAGLGPESRFLLVYPATSTGRPPTYGKIPS